MLARWALYHLSHSSSSNDHAYLKDGWEVYSLSSMTVPGLVTYIMQGQFVQVCNVYLRHPDF
jgi:hypothetical protein